MKNLVLMILLVSSAAIADVRITRFAPVVANNSPVAELCGVVTPAKAQVVRAVVDYNTSAAASYNLMTDSNGAFCGIVATYYGRVEVSAAATSQVASVECCTRSR